MNFLGSLRACAIVIVLATTGLGAIVFLTSASPSRANQAVAGTIGERSLDAEPPVNEAQQNLPVNVGPRSTNADTWRAIRRGLQGMAATPDQRAGVLIQSEGENWRNIRNGPVSFYGFWLLAGVLTGLVLFFAIRGQIGVESGCAGTTVERFSGLERFAHWLVAGSFILLALTGLNMLYGRYALLPLLGSNEFGALSQAGKLAHNFLGFSFIVGVVLILLIWTKDNLPRRCDLVWLAKGGGIFAKGVHVPAHKFNAGQKVIFWIVVWGGTIMSVSGIYLIFPFFFASMVQMQFAQLVHAVFALVFIAVIIAHIYLGTMGMEGAFPAIWNGHVDVNWAREHHDLWVREVKMHKDPENEIPKGVGQADS